MIWLINGSKFAKKLELKHKKDNIFTFRWKNPPKSWWNAKKPIFVDLNFKILETKNIMELINNKDKKYFSRSTESFFNEVTGEEHYHAGDVYDITNSVYNQNKFLKLSLLSKGDIFKIEKVYQKIPCGGWGRLISKEEFLNYYGK